MWIIRKSCFRYENDLLPSSILFCTAIIQSDYGGVTYDSCSYSDNMVLFLSND